MSKDDLWKGIPDSAERIEANEIQNLTKSVDGRLVDVLSNKGTYVNKYGRKSVCVVCMCVVYQT